MRPVFDIIVVGAGHAGCEAALVCGTHGRKDGNVYHEAETRLPEMLCNPLLGGLPNPTSFSNWMLLGGKWPGIQIGLGSNLEPLTPARGLQFKLTGRNATRLAYSARMKTVLGNDGESIRYWRRKSLHIWSENGSVRGIVTMDESEIAGQAVIMTPGMFLNGTIHIGD